MYETAEERSYERQKERKKRRQGDEDRTAESEGVGYGPLKKLEMCFWEFRGSLLSVIPQNPNLVRFLLAETLSLSPSASLRSRLPRDPPHLPQKQVPTHARIHPSMQEGREGAERNSLCHPAACLLCFPLRETRLKKVCQVEKTGREGVSPAQPRFSRSLFSSFSSVFVRLLPTYTGHARTRLLCLPGDTAHVFFAYLYPLSLSLRETR